MLKWSMMPTDADARRAWGWIIVAVLQLIALIAASIALAVYWNPEPHSDWGYYWRAAGESRFYERGGLSLWLLSIPKQMGLGPVVAALMINLPAAAALWLLAYRADGTRWKPFAQAIVGYLLLLSPFMGIVQLDVVAAAQFAIGFWLLLDPRVAMSPARRYVLAVLAIAFAVSTKPQYALTIWALLGMLAVLWIFARRRLPSAFVAVTVVLLAGSVLGFGTDMGFRHFSGRTEQIRTSSAVTLYGGLLVSSDRRDQGCGYWSVRAAEAARSDLGKPLADAIVDRLQARPPAHWLSVVACKAPQIVRPPPYALYWLIESPNVRAGIDASSDKQRIDALYQRALALEVRLYGWLTGLILAMCLWTTVRLWRRLPGVSILTTLWILSFWGVHAIFEIQGRYFLGMFVLAPLLCALLYERAGRVAGGVHATRLRPVEAGGWLKSGSIQETP